MYTCKSIELISFLYVIPLDVVTSRPTSSRHPVETSHTTLDQPVTTTEGETANNGGEYMK